MNLYNNLIVLKSVQQTAEVKRVAKSLKLLKESNEDIFTDACYALLTEEYLGEDVNVMSDEV